MTNKDIKNSSFCDSRIDLYGIKVFRFIRIIQIIELHAFD